LAEKLVAPSASNSATAGTLVLTLDGTNIGISLALVVEFAAQRQSAARFNTHSACQEFNALIIQCVVFRKRQYFTIFAGTNVRNGPPLWVNRVKSPLD
jgi:hypothetical protein